ncbi:hypothetical protein WMY93_018788 [Mugilogobius chulae]|uniref:G-protein coupled receptors family 1 profile domain-containing protein n=1 Tax=Mugilogobius chulae TaxID=88201 RepID=A0AAW0NX45_9GOBI
MCDLSWLRSACCVRNHEDHAGLAVRSCGEAFRFKTPWEDDEDEPCRGNLSSAFNPNLGHLLRSSDRRSAALSKDRIGNDSKSTYKSSSASECGHGAQWPFPTVDVPDHAHYTIGSVILAIGITGMVGNFLVIYAFSRSRSLRTPANMFIINLAITDLLMCVTQTPIFFTTSMHKKWIFGEKACELYAFCGALFGICSMITLTVIAVDRYFVITRPLTSIGLLSRKRAVLILIAAWLYSLAGVCLLSLAGVRTCLRVCSPPVRGTT